MAQPIIQTSFMAGEWAPALAARVDLAKYHQGVALAENFFVDYRGGLSTRPGLKWILQAWKSSSAVRLIPFQASSTVSYALEFGDYYIRFYYAGAPVLESAKTITGITQANPGVVAVASHGYSVGDWVYIDTVVGMTQVNRRYFRVNTVSDANHVGLGKILDSSNQNTSTYTAYSSGGTIQRVYTLVSPYAAADLALLKFAQNVNIMVLCHPSYQPYVLTLISAASWTIAPITFGASIPAPSAGLAITTTFTTGGPPSTWNLAYVVTSVDVNGQESVQSATQNLSITQDPRATAGSINISWTAVPGAQSYNVYRATLRGTSLVASGVPFGYLGNCTGTTFTDSNITADFSITPPLVQNPFFGAGVASITVTAPGAYTTVPIVTVAAPSSGIQATATAQLGALSATVAAPSSTLHAVGEILTPTGDTTLYGGVSFKVATVNGSGQILTVTVNYAGSITLGSTPGNPVNFGSSGLGAAVTLNITWGVTAVTVVTQGSGYTSAPSVTFSAGAAAATANLGTASSGNPTVPSWFQQRLVLAGPTMSPQQFNMSIPGSYYNYNKHFPLLPDDAVQGTIVATKLNTIRFMLPMTQGLVTLTDVGAWIINGGGNAAPVTPENQQAIAQAYSGISNVPPIVAVSDIIYIQAKGSIVRDLSYNFYTSVFTGTDISVLSSHLFYGYQITEWAWAEEPYKLVWAIRDDGTALSLTFMREQEVIGWSHSVTDGSFNSVCSIVEGVSWGQIDATYFVVERTINGTTVQYIERLAERLIVNASASGLICTDASATYSGSPATSFTGADQLAGETCSGLADGVPFTGVVVSVDGGFTLGSAASVVSIGLSYTCDFQCLQLDVGNPTIQSKMKKIPEVTLRVQDTLGLKIGSDFNNLVVMKDLVLGQVGGQTNTVVTGLVTGDARTIIDPKWQTQGQFVVRQDNPYPATILGIMPELTIGDTGR